ncbi:C2H2 type master regulator of conidiophore development brlA [Fusarium oxysporum f. sp. albedinis]|nr:C2H2 type master regulator of conidiophore development brlA [Fusarium oxysporum f. sp. albedinis]
MGTPMKSVKGSKSIPPSTFHGNASKYCTSGMPTMCSCCVRALQAMTSSILIAPKLSEALLLPRKWPRKPRSRPQSVTSLLFLKQSRLSTSIFR